MFAGYRIDHVAGRGGMGVVYRATELALDRRVALKLIAPELAGDPVFRERFVRESRLAASIDHPGILPVYAVGEEEGELFLATRYVEGTDLKGVLERERWLSVERAFGYARQVAAALDAAHACGLVHRDVKPANVLVDGSDHCYLADFGLTKRMGSTSIASGVMVGTLDYVAPEQIRGDPVDGPADQYGLAILVFESLTGVSPFRRPSDAQTLWAHVHERPPSVRDTRPELPAAVDTALRRSFSKEPGDRYPTCSAFINAADGDTTAPLLPRLLPPRLPRGRRGRLVAGALVGAAVIAFVAAVVAARDSGPPALVPNSLIKIDPGSNAVVDVISVGKNPGPVEVVGSYVFVTSEDDETLSRIDLRSDELVTTGAHGGGLGLAGEADKFIWVTNEDRAEIVRVRASTLRAQDRLPLPRNLSHAFAVVGAGSLWVSGTSPSFFRRWHLDPLRLLWQEELTPDEFAVEVGFGDGAAWVGLGNSEQILRIDATNNKKTLISAGTAPSDPTFGFGSVWFGSAFPGDRSIRRIDTITREVTATVDAGQVGAGLAVGEGSVWASNYCDGTVTRIDPTTNEAVATIETGFFPKWLAVGGGFVWVAVAATDVLGFGCD